METHVKVVGWLHIALSALILLVAAFVFVAVIGGGLISGDQNAIRITFLVGFFITAFLVVIAAPGLVAGIGLLKFKPWARILALVLSVFNLLNFPLGTLLGIYTLVVLLSDEANRLFISPVAVGGHAAAEPEKIAPTPATPAVTTVLPPEPVAPEPVVSEMPAENPPEESHPSEPSEPLPPAI